jgi:hypothetical protein
MIFPFIISPITGMPDLFPAPGIECLRFRGESQRQKRKNKRRAHAAGCKKAFK